MNKYTIYCTPEQTKKAYELGAPIKKTCPYTNVNAIWAEGYIELNHGYVDSSDRTTFTILKVPTAEQMIGFILKSGRGYSTDLSELIREQGYKQGCLTFIDSCLK